MQFAIEIVQVDEVKGKKNQRGGLYNAVEVVYKKDGKVEAKPFPDWANVEIYPQLLALKKGDIKTVTTEKVNGFWTWLSIGDGSVSNDECAAGRPANEKPIQHAQGATQRNAGKVIGSNYETSEERAKRQVMIVRQSSISSAVALGEVVKAKWNAQEVIGVAKEFEAYVLS